MSTSSCRWLRFGASNGSAGQHLGLSIPNARPTLHLNPEFSLSIPLGGADADLIGENTLLDCKATSKRGIVGRQELSQLVGYVLADSNDDYAIRAVAIGALRWRSRTDWPLADLLEELADGESGNLDDLGTEFAEMVETDARRPTERREARRLELERRRRERRLMPD